MISLVIILLILSCSDQRKEQQPGNRNTTLDANYINDSTRVLDQQYQKSVFGFIRTKTLELLSSDTALRNTDNQWNLARTKVVLEYCTDPTVRNFWLYVIVKDQLENYGIKNTDAMMKTFYENSPDSASAREIRELYSSDFEGRKGHTIISYKTVGGFSLDAHIFFPDKHDKKHRPAILLFHGGSWYQGKPEWVFGSAKRYASRGLVAIAIEYRLYDRHGTTPLECISDTKSAIRWVRKNADDLGIDPNKIVASGFSAGGHLVACAAMLSILDEPGEDTTISPVPNALIFSSSCFDPTLDSWFVKQVEPRYSAKSVSPIHTVRSSLPPSIVVHGTKDRMCPFWTAEKFAQSMSKAGNICELHQLQGAEHFYFFEKKHREEAILSEEKFLVSLGFL
ncbi:MAG: alpha/beta hydrolase [Ignavibacteriales bacterium]|nr:alpha/beta hydrolase [Ignavibacteriales bacterium]